MFLSQALAVIVASWLAGPIYGMNVVLVATILLKISRKLRCNVARTFALYSLLLLLTCTAQAVVDLILLIAVFDGPGRLASTAHPALTITLVMYCVNLSFSQVLIIWRVYVVSGRKVLLPSIFAISSLFFIAVGTVIVWKFNDVENLFSAVHSIRILSISTWAASAVFQGFGSGYIIWRTYAIPVEAHPHDSSKFYRIAVLTLFVIVDSGCILPLMETVALILDAAQLQASIVVMVSILGQLTAFVPLTIVLRENIKADRDLKKNMVNATSTFLINRMPDVELHHRRSSPSGIATSMPMAVMIRQSELKRSDIEKETLTLDKFDNSTRNV